MLPSTRTPEGEPNQCHVCGVSFVIEVSRPPGDSVCPSCGTLAWFHEETQSTVGRRFKTSAALQVLSGLSSLNLPISETGGLIVMTLRDSLAAYGAVLWTHEARGWWSWGGTLKATAHIGETDQSSSFAEKVVATRKMQMQVVPVSGRETLLIGVPIIRGKRLLGVIEVLQRADSPPDAWGGYLCFIKHIADIATQNITAP